MIQSRSLVLVANALILLVFGSCSNDSQAGTKSDASVSSSHVGRNVTNMSASEKWNLLTSEMTRDDVTQLLGQPKNSRRRMSAVSREFRSLPQEEQRRTLLV